MINDSYYKVFNDDAEGYVSYDTFLKEHTRLSILTDSLNLPLIGSVSESDSFHRLNVMMINDRYINCYYSIEKYTDEWYLVYIYNNSKLSMSLSKGLPTTVSSQWEDKLLINNKLTIYKCDQLTGLIKLINLINKEVN